MFYYRFRFSAEVVSYSHYPVSGDVLFLPSIVLRDAIHA